MRVYVLILIVVFCCFGCEHNSSKSIAKTDNVPLETKQLEYIQLEKENIPEEKVLEVPFVMQAPFANWSIHNESCEEAGLLLARYYYLGQPLTKEQADMELLDMVRFQQEKYGGEYDIYAEEMGKLASDYYGYKNYRVFTGTIENIKQEIIKGNPVIVPTTAVYLKAEKSDYPEMGYHVVVIVGYNNDGFVTHDPGTYTGEDFVYSFAALQNAMVDYNSLVLVLQ